MLKQWCICLLVLVITAYFGIAYLETFPTILLGVELMFVLLSFMYGLLSSAGLRIAFAAPPDTLTVGKKGILQARIKNKYICPVFYGELVVKMTYFQSNEVFTLRLPFTCLPGKTELMRLPVTAHYAGTLRIEPRYMQVYDFLHLFRVRRKLRSRPATVTVLPEFQQLLVFDRSSAFYVPVAAEKLCEEDDSARAIQQFYKDRVGDDPSEVFQVRSYRIGDKLSRVNWKLSAKSGNLVVKDYSYPIIDRTVLLVDLHCENQLAFHQRIHTAVALCISVLELNCSMTLAWYDRQSQSVVQRHLEKDEDLFESIGMLTAASYCTKIAPSILMKRLELSCQLEQMLYITGTISQHELEEMEYLEEVKRIWVYSTGTDNASTRQLSQKVTCHALSRESLENSLAQLSLELY